MIGSYLVAQFSSTSGSSGGTADLVIMLALLAVMLLTIAGMWRVFSKAGQPGWGCLVPIYNVYLMCRIAGRPGWWLIMFFLPVVNIIFSIMVVVGMAKNFGKGAGYAIGLLLLPFPFYPMLGFGGAQYLSDGGDDGGSRRRPDDSFGDEEETTSPAPRGGRPL